MTPAAAYIAACRETGDPISLAHVGRLSGLRDGALHRFIVASLAELPTPPTSGKRARTPTTEMDKWLLLGAAIARESEAERAGRNAANCKAYRTRQTLMAIGREAA